MEENIKYPPFLNNKIITLFLNIFFMNIIFSMGLTKISIYVPHIYKTHRFLSPNTLAYLSNPPDLSMGLPLFTFNLPISWFTKKYPDFQHDWKEFLPFSNFWVIFREQYQSSLSSKCLNQQTFLITFYYILLQVSKGIQIFLGTIPDKLAFFQEMNNIKICKIFRYFSVILVCLILIACNIVLSMIS